MDSAKTEAVRDMVTELERLGAILDRTSDGNVEGLDLSGLPGVNEGLQQAVSLSELRRLRLPARVDDSGLKLLTKLQRLEGLDLRRQAALTEAGLAHLRASRGLGSLRLPAHADSAWLR